MSQMSQDNPVSMQDEFDCIGQSYDKTRSIEAPSNNNIITPLVEKKEKHSSDITNKLTPILSGKVVFS